MNFVYTYYVILVGICYYFYNDRMFLYINLLMNRKMPFLKNRILTFLINYMVFIFISQLQFYLIINWTIFAVFLICEIALLYRCSFKISLFYGIQGALVGLAVNFITRSSAAILFNLPLIAFDSRVSSANTNLKSYPISLGFLLSGFVFWWLYKHFSDWLPHKENPNNSVNLRFSLYLVFALFIYLDLNLLIYFIFSNELIIKLWGIKSGLCVLIGYYIGTSHIYTLTHLEKFEHQSYLVREELKSYKIRENELKQAAYSDCLAGCSTREVGRQTMKKAFEENELFYIYFVDINNLKIVNDNLGHDAGDRYISAVAYALINAAGNKDTVCRYGGDEFLLITSEDGINSLKSSMENLKWELEELSNTSEYPFKLWISYGAACSQECNDVDELMELVDKRMYEAKKNDKKNKCQ